MFSNKDLRNLIVPFFLEQLLMALVGMADVFVVGFLGEAAVSGVSRINAFNMIFMNLFTALAAGGAVVISQYIGRKDNRRAGEAVSQLLLAAVLFSVAISVVVLLAKGTILRFMFGRVEDDVMAACVTYLRISAYSYPALAVYNAGVAGVAWPSLLARMFSAVVITFFCFSEKNPVRYGKAWIFRLDGSLQKIILRIAVPNGIESGIFQLVKVALSSVAALFGTYQIAANGVAQSIWSVASLVASTMGPVFITVIGQCMGAGDISLAEQYFHLPCRNRSQKITPLTTQSRHMAQAMPTTPICRTMANRMENTSRTPMVVNSEVTVVKRTSPAARNPLPRGSAKGNARALNRLWSSTRMRISCLVCGSSA